jgi:thymidylate synthase
MDNGKQQKQRASIKVVRREVRKSLSRSGFPLPVTEIVRIHRVTGETPLVIVAISEAEFEKKKVAWRPWEEAYLKAHMDLPNEVLAKVLKRGPDSVKGKKFCLRKKEKACRES